eukprot:Pgem_evm1s18837
MMTMSTPTYLITIAVLLNSTYFSLTQACTDFVYMTKNQSEVVVGRDMEFYMDTQSSIYTHPRGELQSSLSYVYDNDKKGDIDSERSIVNSNYQWIVQYGYVGINVLGGNLTVDGMNDVGLSCSLLILPGYCDYQVISNSTQNQNDKVMMQWSLCDWALSQYSNVKEVNNSLSDITVWKINGNELTKSPWFTSQPQYIKDIVKNIDDDMFDVHYSLHDADGNSLVIEYVNGGNAPPKTYNNALGVLTNSPTYDWHVNNVKQYVGLSGLNVKAKTLGVNTINKNYKINAILEPVGLQGNFLGLPGDFGSQS